MNLPESFSIGEVAIFWDPASRNHGIEVTITGPLEFTNLWNADNTEFIGHVPTYPISGPIVGKLMTSGWAARPEDLRKKRPPSINREQLGRWDDCPWQPAEVRVENHS